MTMSHVETDRETFYRRIGIKAITAERCPGSAVHAATTIYLDENGQEIGRVERHFKGPRLLDRSQFLLASDPFDNKTERAYIWL